jgi:HEAT repeat protein
MKIISKLFITAAFIFATALPVLAGKPTEDALLTDLASTTPKVVISALQDLEKNYPNSAASLPKIKALLTDSRPEIRTKAARVLGATHAEVSAEDLNNIAALLTATDKTEVMQGLKSLRGLKAQSVVPKILPLLTNADSNIKRDACRTLAAIADKSVVKDIEPLLHAADKAVVKDAQAAIATLNNR